MVSGVGGDFSQTLLQTPVFHIATRQFYLFIYRKDTGTDTVFHDTP